MVPFSAHKAQSIAQEKILGITTMPPCEDIQQLLLFLAMITFMQPSMSHLSHHNAFLHELLKLNKTAYLINNTYAVFQKYTVMFTTAHNIAIQQL